MAVTTFTNHLRELVSGVDVILSDIWGVVHNGLKPSSDACDALSAFREAGSGVVLITQCAAPGGFGAAALKAREPVRRREQAPAGGDQQVEMVVAP